MLASTRYGRVELVVEGSCIKCRTKHESILVVSFIGMMFEICLVNLDDTLIDAYVACY